MPFGIKLKFMKSFHRIVLYARQHRATFGVHETLQRLTDYWKKASNLQIFLENETAKHFTHLDLPVADLNESTKEKNYDLLVVVGGDGSLLGAARLAVQHQIPIIGINRGRLGFLTTILPEEAEKKLDEVMLGKYEEEHRFLLKACILDDNKNIITEKLALNDVVLRQGEDPAMIEFDVFDDKALICRYRADGLIAATPTGSTAYALSAGGPIVHPTVSVITIVPMFPHTLSSRPIVLGTKKPIYIHLRLPEKSSARLISDGQDHQEMLPNQSIRIEKYPEKLCLLQPLSYNYYETLRSKLSWEAPNF